MKGMSTETNLNRNTGTEVNLNKSLSTEPNIGRISIPWRVERLPANRYSFTICTFILLSYFFEAVDNGAVGFFMPLFAKEFKLSSQMLGYVGTASNVGVMIGAIFSGLFCDRLGRKNVIIAAMLLWGVCGLLLANASTLNELLVARVLLGLGIGAQTPAVLSILSELLPAKLRGKYFTALVCFLPLGAATAGLITYYLVPLIGWRGVAVVEAVPALFALAVWKYVPESPFWLESRGRFAEADAVMDKIEKSVEQAIGGKLPPVQVPANASTSVKQEKVSFFELFNRKHIKTTLLCTIWWPTALAAFYGLMIWFNVLLVSKGFDVIKSIGYVTIMYGAGVLGLPFVRYSIETYGRKPTAIAMGVFAAFFSYFYGAAESLPFLILFGILYNVFSNATGMVNNLYTAEMFPTRIRGTGTGYASFTGRIGAIAGPIAIGYIMHAYGLMAVFYFAMSMYLTFSLAIFFLGEETKGKVFTE